MVFNSLGSNYNWRFVVRSLFSTNLKNASEKLISLLNKRYSGKSALLYKGREAIKLALGISGISKGSKVGVNGFTCYVVYQAITEAGYKPVYLDINGRDLNFDAKILEENSDIKALIVQNTLGNPVDIVPIKSFCDKKRIVLIEDLAHSVGSVYPNGTEAGCVGDFVALSFSQDKVIDAVSGGALIVRNNKFEDSLKNVEYKKLPLRNQIHDRLYPLLTFLIRKLYPIGIGKPLHHFLKKMKVLSDPIGNISVIEPHNLSEWYVSLVLYRFIKYDEEIKHREKITKIYLQNINKQIVSDQISDNYRESSNIRFPIFINNRNSLINYLKDNSVYVSDIWYDAPVAPSKLIGKTDYKGSCNKSEEISRRILNLPTNINVSEDNAEKISALINKWQNMN